MSAICFHYGVIGNGAFWDLKDAKAIRSLYYYWRGCGLAASTGDQGQTRLKLVRMIKYTPMK